VEYAKHADTYAQVSEVSPTNVSYDRPAILRLAGDVHGRRVLELGCAAGVLTEHLADRGADVLALDREPRLIAHARDRVGTRAQFELADLERPLDVPTGTVDIVVASLVLHYLEDWMPLLAELHRCLHPGGALVFSVHHPITGWLLSDRTDYHRVERIDETWDWNGHEVVATMYRRPLATIFGDLRHAGFRIDVVDEPRPEPDTRPDLFEVLDTHPVFLFFRALRADH
jgi:SAM-dependent methyltransferase